MAGIVGRNRLAVFWCSLTRQVSAQYGRWTLGQLPCYDDGKDYNMIVFDDGMPTCRSGSLARGTTIAFCDL